MAKRGFQSPADRLALQERRLRVSRFYLEGRTQMEIAAREGVDQGTVSNDLKAIRAEWAEKRAEDLDVKMDIEMAKIDNLELIAMEAWIRSMKPAETKVKKVEAIPMIKEDEGDNKKGKKKKTVGTSIPMVEIKRVVEMTRKGQVGDPRFLDRISWCIETRLKLMGRLSGEKTVINNTNNNQANTQVNWWDSMVRLEPPSANGKAPVLTHDPVEEELAKLAATPVPSKPSSKNGTSNGNGHPHQ